MGAPKAIWPEIDPETMKSGIDEVPIRLEMINAGIAIFSLCSARFDSEEMIVRAIYTAMRLLAPESPLKVRRDGNRFFGERVEYKPQMEISDACDKPFSL